MNFAAFFNLTNIIKSATCFTKFHSSTMDLFLTNKPKSFQKTNVIGMSFFKFYYKRFKPKIVYYRSYKFNEANFLKNVKNCDFSL